MSKKPRGSNGPGGQGGNGKMPERKFQDGVKLVSSSVKAVAASNMCRDYVCGERRGPLGWPALRDPNA